MIWRKAALLLPLCCFALGCDRRDDIPPPSRPPAETPKRPTTQFLESSPRTRLQLAGAPLTIMAPPGWEIKSHDSSVDTLEGPAPTVDIEIQIVRSQIHLTNDQMTAILASLAQPKDPAVHVKIDDRGELKIVSIVKSNRVGDEDLIDWRLRTFTPFGAQFLEYDLSFIGLSRSEYEQNKDFLERMLASITYGKLEDLP